MEQNLVSGPKEIQSLLISCFAASSSFCFRFVFSSFLASRASWMNAVQTLTLPYFTCSIRTEPAPRADDPHLMSPFVWFLTGSFYFFTTPAAFCTRWEEPCLKVIILILIKKRKIRLVLNNAVKNQLDDIN